VPDSIQETRGMFNLSSANVLPRRQTGREQIIVTKQPSRCDLRCPALLEPKQKLPKSVLTRFSGKAHPASTVRMRHPSVLSRRLTEIRIRVDYRQLNAIIRKNRNARPATKEALLRMAKVRIMSVVDIIVAFNTVCIAEGHKKRQTSSRDG
jgi:hypothetical protein